MKRLESIVFVGWVLLLISVILDDLTTHILFQFGFEVLETNPIYQLVGSKVIFALIGVVLYSFVAWAWYYIVDKYRRIFKDRERYYKTYDIFVFLFCFILIFIIVIKISAGVSNLQTMTLYFTDEGKEMIDYNLKQIELTKQNHPEVYDTAVKEYYEDHALKVGYWQLVMMVLGTYLLFRIGMRVGPSDLT